jgi:hypothetical protein
LAKASVEMNHLFVEITKGYADLSIHLPSQQVLQTNIEHSFNHKNKITQSSLPDRVFFIVSYSITSLPANALSLN